MGERCSYDVAVVGAGIVGASVARAVARTGATVVVLDAGPAVAARASDVPVALVNPWRGRKGDAHPDDLRATDVMHRWARELQSEMHGERPPEQTVDADGLHVTGFHPTGVVRVAGDARQAAAWQARCDAHEDLAWWHPHEVPAGFQAPFGAMLVTNGAWLDAPVWRSSVLASARRHGAHLHAGTAVTSIARWAAGWRLTAQSIDDAGAPRGTIDVDARQVVVCTGAHAVQAWGLDRVGVIPPPWTLHAGHLAALAMADTETSASMPLPIAGSVYAVPMKGWAWVGGGHAPVPASAPDITEAVTATADPTGLRRAIARSVPSLASSTVTRVWSGVRARSGSGRPSWVVVVPGVAMLGGFAGRGFLAAALEAERAAARLHRPTLGV